MGERALVAACLQNREAYERVAPLIKEGNLSEQGSLIFKHIGEYYARDPAAIRVEVGTLEAAVGRSVPNPKHKAAFSTLIRDLGNVESSPANVVAEYVGVRQAEAGARLASALAAGRPYTETASLVAEYEEWSRGELPEGEEAEEGVVMRGASLRDLVRTNFDPGQLIQVWPKALNDRLDGGVLRGHHILAFAVPEAGKTLFALNAMYGFLRQGLTVLYCGNEDPIEDLVLRAATRIAERTKFQVMDDPDGTDALIRERGYDNLVLASLTPGTPREIDDLVVEYRTDVVIVDQVRNLHVGEGSDDPVRQMDIAVKAIRRIGKKRKALMVSLTQAGDSAQGKAVLDMSDVYGSKTAAAAQADVMVGIGGTFEDFQYNRRVLSLPKNKRSGNHSFFPVMIDPTLNKMRGLD